ncbi:hypothetical protein [Brachybacterium paraconglomeratum]|uniref:hypothetical protein n=1 Tax=Brachybacterium paraconglomeratum TaxID=173362 RepID=UPI0031E67BA9
MELLLPSRRTVPPSATGPPADFPPPGHGLDHEQPALTSIGLCAAWSRHAAELAVPLGAALQRWEETPSTHTLVADGYLARILPGIFLPPDLLRSAVRRALALGCALGAQLQAHHVIAGPSAAWVVLGGPPPPSAELLSPAHRGDQAGVVLRHARLQPDEVETIGGAPVTIPVRTAMDLLRFAPSWVAEPTLRRLVAAGHVQVPQIRQRLHRMYRHPGVHAARERLEQMLGDQRETSGVPEPTGLPSAVTRYTS